MSAGSGCRAASRSPERVGPWCRRRPDALGQRRAPGGGGRLLCVRGLAKSQHEDVELRPLGALQGSVEGHLRADDLRHGLVCATQELRNAKVRQLGGTMKTIRLAVGLLLGGATTIGCDDRTLTASGGVPPAPTAIVMGQIDPGHPYVGAIIFDAPSPSWFPA